MNELLVIKTKQPSISMNFEQAKAHLNAELVKYQNVVVTLETLPDDKKLAQSINAMAKEFSAKRIAKVKEISAPIKAFESQMKELENLAKDTSNQIKIQVEKFEAEKLNQLESDILDLINSQRDNLGVKSEFRSRHPDISNLIKLTNITSTGKPNKAAKDGANAISNSELQIQQQTEMRLLKLENESLKAGLHAPLQRINVESFLFCDADIYDRKLNELIESELNRQAQAEKSQRERLEREAQQKFEAQQAKASSDVALIKEIAHEESIQEYEKPEPAKTKVEDGKRAVLVTATFLVKVPEHVPGDAIKNKLAKTLADAGFTSLETIEVKNV